MVFKQATFHGRSPEIDAKPVDYASLEKAVAAALAAAGGLDASDVEVTAQGDTIILSGRVASTYEIERASTVACSVSGVRVVRNQILSS
jgi:osmotically-inducible protein OsmY